MKKNIVACSCITYVSFMHFYADEDIIVKYSSSSLTSGVSAVGLVENWGLRNHGQGSHSSEPH